MCENVARISGVAQIKHSEAQGGTICHGEVTYKVYDFQTVTLCQPLEQRETEKD